MPACIECGEEVNALLKEFSKGCIRLETCPKCEKTVDKYVEFDSIHIFLDILLQRIEAHRHLFFNRIPYLTATDYTDMTVFFSATSLICGFLDYLKYNDSSTNVSVFLSSVIESIGTFQMSTPLLCVIGAFARALLFSVAISYIITFLRTLSPKASTTTTPPSPTSPQAHLGEITTTTTFRFVLMTQIARLFYLVPVIWMVPSISSVVSNEAGDVDPSAPPAFISSTLRHVCTVTSVLVLSSVGLGVVAAVSKRTWSAMSSKLQAPLLSSPVVGWVLCFFLVVVSAIGVETLVNVARLLLSGGDATRHNGWVL